METSGTHVKPSQKDDFYRRHNYIYKSQMFSLVCKEAKR